MEAPSRKNPIIFDKVEHDFGNNYNAATGVYTAQHDGLYLIHARVYGEDNNATHYIRVNGEEVSCTEEYNPNYRLQSSSTSIVLHLKAGDEVTIDANFQKTISGNPQSMLSSFGANILYPD